jgi:putative hydrolase of the HAD superfamily
VTTTHILFDFFGTLVDYDDGHIARPVRSLSALHELGFRDLTLASFSAGWAEVWASWESRCAPDGREFSMVDVASSFLSSLADRPVPRSTVDVFVEVFIAEWNEGVRYPPGVPGLLRALAPRYRLAVVSDTHEPLLVPGHLAAMGVADLFDAVVTSVEVGVRKPHPRVYATALSRLGIAAPAAVFVGDSLEADYHGPTAVGMRAFLIDPAGVAPVPPGHRLDSVLDLAALL